MISGLSIAWVFVWYRPLSPRARPGRSLTVPATTTSTTSSSTRIGSSTAGPFFEVVFALLVTELAIIGMLCVPVPGGLLRPVVRQLGQKQHRP